MVEREGSLSKYRVFFDFHFRVLAPISSLRAKCVLRRLQSITSLCTDAIGSGDHVRFIPPCALLDFGNLGCEVYERFKGLLGILRLFAWIAFEFFDVNA